LAEAGGAPVLERVTDLGGGDVPGTGELKIGRSDSVAAVGEALWIQGRSFGRQPTVTIGGRPAAALSRTGDGGILVRVPVATPAGAQPVVVTQENGRAQTTIEIRRYAAVLLPGAGVVAWAALGPDGPAALGTTRLPGRPAFLAVSADGRAAYTLGGEGVIMVLELPAPGLPAEVGRLTLDRGWGPAVALLAASTAHRLVAVGANEVVVFDTGTPLQPVRRAVVPLKLARGGKVARATLSPDGRHLAMIVAGAPRVAIVDLAGSPSAAAEHDLPAGVREAALTDLAYAHDGRTLWVLTGEGAGRIAAGSPTQVFALRIPDVAAGRPSMDAPRAVAVEVAARPVRLSTGRSLPLASGATIRLPPEKATVYLAASVRGAARSAVFAIGAEDRASELLVADGENRIGGVDITPDGRWVLAAAVARDGSLQLLSAPADGRPGAPRVVALGAALQGETVSPEVRLQP
jgi:hypothetical protein